MSYDPNPKQQPKDTTPTPTSPSLPPSGIWSGYNPKVTRHRPEEKPGKDQYITDPITGRQTRRYPGMEGFLPEYVTPQLNNDAWGGWSNTYGNNNNQTNSPVPQASYGNNPISTAPIPAASNPAGLTQPSIVPAASFNGPSLQTSNPFTPLRRSSNRNQLGSGIPSSGFSGSFSNPNSTPNQVSSQAMLIRRGR